MKLSSLILLLAFMATTVRAQSEKSPCDMEQNQTNMNLCSMEKYEAADASLNFAYKKLMEDRGEEMAAKIRETQRLWIKFRDSHCECHAMIYEGGSMQPLVRNTCMTELTEKRCKELEELYDAIDL